MLPNDRKIISPKIENLKNEVRINVGIIMLTAKNFELLLIAPYNFQLVSKGPKSLWLSNHNSNFLEDFEKNQPAIIIKIVVGSPGINTPKKPNPTKMKPRII